MVGDIKEGWERILSPEAVQFLADIHRNFEPTRQSVLQTRIDRQKLIDQGEELKVSLLLMCVVFSRCSFGHLIVRFYVVRGIATSHFAYQSFKFEVFISTVFSPISSRTL